MGLLKDSMLVLGVCLLGFVSYSAAIKCYVCNSGSPSVLVVGDNTNGSLTQGSIYPGGYIYKDVNDTDKMIPWRDFYKGNDCDEGRGKLVVVDCQVGCLKAKFTIDNSKVKEFSRIYRQCAYPNTDNKTDISKYEFGKKDSIKRSGTTKGLHSFFYYCNDVRADGKPCNRSSPISQPLSLAALMTVTLLCLLPFTLLFN